MPQLTNIITITATLELVTGLRIGAGDSEMKIGGIDNAVIKHPHTQSPYIPGSSIKGKMRSLLEWRSGAVQQTALGWEDYQKAKNTPQEAEVKRILQLFGISGDAKIGLEQMMEIGSTRISFWDCNLNANWEESIRADEFSLTEVKTENCIKRISGKAEHPRQSERVPAGAKFDFQLSIKRFTDDGDDLLQTVLEGLKLLELDSLGSSGSRGYGKIKFANFQIDGKDEQARFDNVKAFG